MTSSIIDRYRGDTILVAGAAAGVSAALFDYFQPNNGIRSGSWGALLVVTSSALVLAASVILAMFAQGTTSSVLIGGAILLGLIGTGGSVLSGKQSGDCSDGGGLGGLAYPRRLGAERGRTCPAERQDAVPMIKFAVLVVLATFIAPLQVWAQPQTWPTFNGDLRAQKFPPKPQSHPPTSGNYRSMADAHRRCFRRKRRKAEDGLVGDAPFVNNTLYLGTPFYRISRSSLTPARSNGPTTPMAC